MYSALFWTCFFIYPFPEFVAKTSFESVTATRTASTSRETRPRPELSGYLRRAREPNDYNSFSRRRTTVVQQLRPTSVMFRTPGQMSTDRRNDRSIVDERSRRRDRCFRLSSADRGTRFDFSIECAREPPKCLERYLQRSGGTYL